MPDDRGPRSRDSVGTDAIARRLDRLHEAVRPEYDDEVFDLLEGLGRDGVGVAIAVLADGVLFVGAIGSPSDFADAVTDAATDAIAGVDFTDDERQEILSSFNEAEDELRSLIEERQEVVDGYDAEIEIDDIAVADVFEYIGAFRKPASIDLRDVTVHHSGSPPFDVEHVRLLRSHISAWWPLKAQGVDIDYVVQPGDGSD